MITSYETLPLGKYEAIQALAGEKDADLDVIGILADLTEDELLNMPLTQYAQLRDDAAFLFHEPKGHKLAKRYKLTTCEVIPCTNERNLTTAQYIDFKELIKTDHSTADLLSVFLIPEGKTYGEGYDIVELRKDIADSLCCLDAIALVEVFMTRLGRLMRVSLTSMRATARKIQDKEKRTEIMANLKAVEHSLKNGAGFGNLTLLRSLPTKLLRSYITTLLSHS